MSDIKERILEVIKQPQLSSFATVTADGKPWVRYVVTIADDAMRIRFATFVSARKVQHIKQNPEVHIACGVNGLDEMNPYLQIQGKATLSTTKEERHGFWNEMLAPIFEGPDDPNYGIIVVEPHRIEYCAPGEFEPEVWEG